MPPDQPLAMLRELRFEETCKRPSTTNLERFTGSYVVYCMYLQDRGGGGRLVRWLCVEAEVSLIGVPVDIWVVVKIRVLFWVPIIIRHLLFRVPKKGP